MGDLSRLPEHVAQKAVKMMEKTKDINEFIFNLCINYSGQDELVYAVNSIISEGIEKVTKKIEELMAEELARQAAKGRVNKTITISTSLCK